MTRNYIELGSICRDHTLQLYNEKKRTPLFDGLSSFTKLLINKRNKQNKLTKEKPHDIAS